MRGQCHGQCEAEGSWGPGSAEGSRRIGGIGGEKAPDVLTLAQIIHGSKVYLLFLLLKIMPTVSYHSITGR